MNDDFRETLRAGLQGKRPEESIPACRELGVAIARRYAQLWDSRIERLSVAGALRSAQNTNERSLIDSYAAERGHTPALRWIPGREGQEAYAKILFDDPLCLACHGTVGRDVQPPVAAALSGHPAILGARLGDIAGFWVLRNASGGAKSHPR